MKSEGENGIASLHSAYSFEETIERLEKILQARNITLFAMIDHSGEAAKIGMQMLPTKVLIIGSPKAGTPAMIAAPTLAIDLPLKILVSKDADRQVWISYNAPGYLQARHGLPPELTPNISAVEAIAKEAAEQQR